VLASRLERAREELHVAYDDVHRTRVVALRRARDAERSARLAGRAREHARHLIDQARRLAGERRVVPGALPDAGDAFRVVQRLRTDALKQASVAESAAAEVERARSRAARRLDEVRAIEAEIRRLDRH
jgi:hypothetical protein